MVGENGQDIAADTSYINKIVKSDNDKADFMAVLKDEFESVTRKLKDVPGMPGVYVVNQPQQTLNSLKIEPLKLS